MNIRKKKKKKKKKKERKKERKEKEETYKIVEKFYLKEVLPKEVKESH